MGSVAFVAMSIIMLAALGSYSLVMGWTAIGIILFVIVAIIVWSQIDDLVYFVLRRYRKAENHTTRIRPGRPFQRRWWTQSYKVNTSDHEMEKLIKATRSPGH